MNDIFNKQLTMKDIVDIYESRAGKSKNLKVKLIQTFNVVKSEILSTETDNSLKKNVGLIFYKIFKYKVASDSGKRYTVFIKTSPSFSLKSLLSSGVQVFCQCPDFMYRSAYELSKNGNLFLNKATALHLSNALKVVPTKITTTNICKHVYATLIYFKDNLKNYGLIKSK
jgi:hypothetical protein